jgi:hypothetical protein
LTKLADFGEPPTFKGDMEKWIKDTEKYLRQVHQLVLGLGGDGGALDGHDNITSAIDPGIADGSLASVTLVVNNLTDNLQVTGIVGEA